jgi:hypothetical protein
MQRIVDPQQSRMFDPFDPVLTDKTRARLLDGWPGVVRHVVLELMPVGALGEHYSLDMGRPTKELYSMAGLILLMECMDWTKQDALDAYSYRMDVHYALNMEPVTHDISIRTLERYILIFEQDKLARSVMNEVTVRLAELLEIKIDRQRLDSTHVFSNMASFGRTRLMGVAIKRFLTQVQRHDPSVYASLSDSLRQRYRPSVHQMFGDTGKDKESRHLLRLQVAEDMHLLIGRFAEMETHRSRSSYKSMEQIFYEQCEVHEKKVTLKEKSGSDVMQNPSDPDATYDGHKGPGYQVQISETCHPDNEVQLVTAALAQTAAKSDAEAVEPVMEDLQESGLLPQEMLVDTSYASDENVQTAKRFDVELVGPVPGSKSQAAADDLTIDDFNVGETSGQVVCCPAGHKPVSSVHDTETGKTRTTMPDSTCGACEYFDQCPVEKKRNGYQVDHTAKQRRTAARRHEEATDVFRDRYRVRGGIEGTNSGLKRRTGLGRVRVRGGPRVFHAIYLKITGWNILRASVCAKMRKIVRQRAYAAVFWACFGAYTLSYAHQSTLGRFRSMFLALRSSFNASMEFFRSRELGF